jgi:hypothetical protein
VAKHFENSFATLLKNYKIFHLGEGTVTAIVTFGLCNFKNVFDL